ncbi:hypothetical protein DFH94DRAFT_852776 [Russula ochroleuca]|uniref:Uncharacterized protein n=1 Tax=Russula ochroleuca TaxID=152965 RepID=A0A9P5MYW3_9AGAM|nr:hypothetical protein DFH94DRAFT_852776 [Russula ochroleuca]
MSDSATTPAQDTATPSIDTQQLQQPPPPQSLVQDSQLHAQLHQNSQPTISDPPRKRAFPACLIFLLLCLPVRIRWLESLTRIFLLILSKSPSRKACVHFLSFWKDSLQRDPPMSGRYLSISAFLSCLKRGLGATCAYPDPEAPVDHSQQQTPAPGIPPFPAAPISYMQPPSLTHQQYYEYNGSFTGASTSTFRPNKRPRPLTEEEAAAITRNFSRGDFYIGTSAPIRIDPRLPVRLTLGEGDHVHFTIGETLV